MVSRRERCLPRLCSLAWDVTRCKTATFRGRRGTAKGAGGEEEEEEEESLFKADAVNEEEEEEEGLLTNNE